MRGMKQKAVDAVTTEPFLHVIGDVARRADQRTLPPSRGEALVDLPDRQTFLPRPADDVAGIAEAAECELPFGYVGKRTIEIVFRQVEPAELVREQFEPDIGVDLRLQEMVQFLRLFAGPSDDRIETRHYFQRFWRAVVLSHALLQVAVELRRGGTRGRRCGHPLRDARCRLAATRGRAGLEEHRMALRRPRDIQRATNREMLALVVQVMELGRVEIAFRSAVSDKRIVVPAVPQSLYDFHKLDRTVVAGIVLIVPLASEVEGL